MPEFIAAQNYVRCSRCLSFFIPIDISPTTATVRCPSCHTSSRLPTTRPPPPPPPTQFNLTETDDDLDSITEEEDDDFDIDWPAEADDYEPNPNPAAASFINSLNALNRAVSHDGLKQLNRAAPLCVVCLDDFKLEERVNEMPCGHWFHSDCIIRWLDLNNTCPVCRYEIPMEPDQDIFLRSFWIVQLKQRQWSENSSVTRGRRNTRGPDLGVFNVIRDSNYSVIVGAAN